MKNLRNNSKRNRKGLKPEDRKTDTHKKSNVPFLFLNWIG